MTTQERVTARLAHWLGLADARHVAEGKAWYREANGFARELSQTYDIPMPQVVGVIAAISPSVNWDLNKRQAENLCKAYADGGALEDVVVSTYGGQVEKARKILHDARNNTDITKMLGTRAFKTKAFFNNIFWYPVSDSVTIDQYIVDAAGFEKAWVNGAKWCYEVLARAITDLATDKNLRPYEVQAIIWVTYKDLTGAQDEPDEEPEADNDDDSPIPF